MRTRRLMGALLGGLALVGCGGGGAHGGDEPLADAAQARDTHPGQPDGPPDADAAPTPADGAVRPADGARPQPDGSVPPDAAPDGRVPGPDAVMAPDGMPLGDAAQPDAAPPQPDAAPPQPDAAPAQLDAAPVQPDAAPAQLDAAPVQPDAAPAQPSCPVGLADCDGLPEDGCETPLNTPTHCGACDTVCRPGSECTLDGRCDNAAISVSWGDPPCLVRAGGGVLCMATTAPLPQPGVPPCIDAAGLCVVNDKLTPMPGIPPAVAVSTGTGHACVVTRAGDEYCWGGHPPYEPNALTPTLVPHEAPVAQAVVGRFYACERFVGAPGLTCRGWNTYGGNMAIAELQGRDDIAEIGASDATMCARFNDGTVGCWSGRAPTLQTIQGIDDAVALEFGLGLCARLGTGAIVCWGGDAFLGTFGAPTPVPALSNMASLFGALGASCGVRGVDEAREATCVSARGDVFNLPTFGGAQALFGYRGRACAAYKDGHMACFDAVPAGPEDRPTSLAVQCLPGLTDCSESCVDLSTDPDSCGACFHTCAEGEACAAGACVPAEPCVDGSCLLDRVQVELADQFAVARTRDGHVLTWARGIDGLRESDPQDWTANYALDTGITDAADLDAGDAHACVVKTTGEVVCFGDGTDGETGVDGNPGVADAVRVSSGSHHNCAVRSNGHVACWGRNVVGTVDPQAPWNDFITTAVDPLASLPEPVEDAVDAAVTEYSTCVARSDGSVWCWGSPNRGDLPVGDGAPGPLDGVAEVVTLESGRMHVCALTRTGEAICWGVNDQGQLGRGFTSVSEPPAVVPGLSGLLGISLGGASTCVLTADRHVQCFGANESGQLGDETVTPSLTPVTVRNLENVQSVACGGSRCYVTRRQGQVQAFGTTDWYVLTPWGEVVDLYMLAHYVPGPVQGLPPGP